MRTRALLFLILAVFCSSCATMPSGMGRQLAKGIKDHAYATRRAVILGDGVSSEAATRAAEVSGAMVFFCASRSDQEKLGVFERDVVESLRAMALSGDEWEVAVAIRAGSRFAAILSSMKTEELKSFRGKLAIPARLQNDLALQAQLKRVFGGQVVLEYITAGAGQ